MPKRLHATCQKVECNNWLQTAPNHTPLNDCLATMVKLRRVNNIH